MWDSVRERLCCWRGFFFSFFLFITMKIKEIGENLITQKTSTKGQDRERRENLVFLVADGFVLSHWVSVCCFIILLLSKLIRSTKIVVFLCSVV